MADKEYVKRVNYFTHQFLEAKDFTAEQQYHLKMRRRHNRVFHSWGVAEGLEVTKNGENTNTYLIKPGTAVDRYGREIVLLDKEEHTLQTTEPQDWIYLTIRYPDEKLPEEIWDINDKDPGGTDNYIRLTEKPKIELNTQPKDDGSVIILAKIKLKDGTIEIDNTVRKYIGLHPLKPIEYDGGPELTSLDEFSYKINIGGNKDARIAVDKPERSWAPPVLVVQVYELPRPGDSISWREFSWRIGNDEFVRGVIFHNEMDRQISVGFTIYGIYF
ncbi:MAG: hypothetical protein H6632_19705 [Anaerolineales bacterium]|nr:hypothetical protein [Anaerolineales bacterium]